jgi:hypothetical protein
MTKLDELEAEEDKLIKTGFYDDNNEPQTEETKKIKKLAKRFYIFFLNLTKIFGFI